MAVYLTVYEVAERLKVSPNTVRRWLRRGQIPGRKVGKAFRVVDDDLRRFISEGEAEPAPARVQEQEIERKKERVSARGFLANVPGFSTEEHMRRKREDLEEEERRWAERHRR